MKFKYEKYKEKENPKNAWVVYVSWCHGDADHSETVDYKCKSEESLSEFLDWLAKIEKVEIDEDDESMAKFIDNVPHDIVAGCGERALFERIEEVIYFDAAGKKHLVKYE